MCPVETQNFVSAENGAGFCSQAEKPEEARLADLIGNRDVLAKRLTTLIENTQDPYVIGLNSGWGTGKTFFLKAWVKYLKEEKNFFCVYFNAWEKDYSGDPLVNLISETEKQINDFQTLKSEEKKKIKDKITTICNLVSDICEVSSEALKGFSFTIFGIQISWLGGALSAIGKGTKKIVERTAAKDKTSTELKTELQELAKEIKIACLGFPLFIMVDELDRCRPDYAIELLEKIKHLFDEKNIVFLIAVDGKQLLQQVEHTFGLKQPTFLHSENSDLPSQHNDDGSDTRLNYLGKFFNIFYQLPEPNRQEFIQLKLNNMPEIQSYCKKFHELPYLKLGLIPVLAADINLFGNKSLRELIQNLELFSVFLRLEPDLQFEELFTAFLMIMGNRNRMMVSQNVTTALREKYPITKISRGVSKTRIIDVEKNQIIENVHGHFRLNQPASVAHFWICMKMLYEPVKSGSSDFDLFFNAVCNSMLMGIAYTEQASPQYIPHMTLQPMDQVEKSLTNKLQLLEAFSQTISSEETENANNTKSTAEAHAVTSNFGKLCI